MDDAVRLARRGRGASALAASENGVRARLDRFAEAQPLDTAMAVTFTRHAEVLHGFGDPDLAVAAADVALRIFTNRPADLDRAAFVRAATIAEDVHAASGRTEHARAAAGLIRQTAPGAVPDPPLAGPEPLLERISLARALGRLQPPPGVAASRLPDPQPLIDALTASPTDCSLVTTSQRCTPEDLPTVAGLLASFAEATVGADPAAGLRLGLEAHVLYAWAEVPLPPLRHEQAAHGPPWARALLACARACDRHGRAALAGDLAGWMGGVVEQLLPYAHVDTAVRATATECLAWHADLLERTGHPAGAASARATLSRLRQEPS